MLKIKWKVSEVPVGRYRSFEKRGWPSADYIDENGNEFPCATILCKDEYYPKDAKTGNHSALQLLIADYKEKPWKYKSLIKRFNTIKEAKNGLHDFLVKHPEWKPKSKEKENPSFKNYKPEWKPISKIPEDGTFVLGFDPESGGYLVVNKPKGYALGNWWRNNECYVWSGESCTGHVIPTLFTDLPK